MKGLMGTSSIIGGFSNVAVGSTVFCDHKVTDPSPNNP